MLSRKFQGISRVIQVIRSNSNPDYPLCNVLMQFSSSIWYLGIFIMSSLSGKLNKLLRKITKLGCSENLFSMFSKFEEKNTGIFLQNPIFCYFLLLFKQISYNIRGILSVNLTRICKENLNIRIRSKSIEF